MTTTIAGIIRSGKLELLDEPLGLRDGRVTVTIDVEPTTQSEMARVDRREFLRLPLLERRRILKDQADKLASHYERDGEWTEWLAGYAHDATSLSALTRFGSRMGSAAEWYDTNSGRMSP